MERKPATIRAYLGIPSGTICRFKVSRRECANCVRRFAVIGWDGLENGRSSITGRER